MFKSIKCLLVFALAIGSAYNSYAQGTLSGTIQTPNSAVPIRNGTLTLTLSQSGVVVGSAALSTTPVSCYTSTSGQIVGVKNPLTAPALSTNVLAGSLPAATYFVYYTGYDSSGESLYSPEASVALIGTGTVNVALPSVPTGQTGWKVYVSTTTGTETQQGSTLTNSYAQAVALVGGAALPSSNSSLCKVRFNDTITPYPTKYRVSLVDANGATVPGFGFFAMFTGSAIIDISNGWPTARDIETRYFTPIIASPLSNASQSINSPITLNGYQLSTGSVLGSGLTTTNKPGCASAKGVLYYDTTLNKWRVCENGGAYGDMLAAGGGWQRTAGLISEQVITDKVLTGAASTDLTDNGAVIAKPVVYAISATTNARVAGIGVLTGTSLAYVASGVSGTQTTGWPLTFRVCPAAGDCSALGTSEVARFETGGRLLVGLTSTDVGGANMILSAGAGGLAIASAATDASVLSLSAVTGNYASIASNKTGAGAYLPLVFFTNGAEAARIDTSKNLLIGLTTADDATSGLLSGYRTQNAPSWVSVRNANAGTLAYSAFRAIEGVAGSTNEVELGVTSTGFTPVGGITTEKAFLRTSAANGLQINTDVGTINFSVGGASKGTFAAGGLTLSTVLAQAYGGTGSGAITATDVIYTDGTAYQGSANFTWTNATPRLTVAGGMLATSAARTNPAAGTYLHDFYDSGTDRGEVLSYNYSTAAYKNLKISGLVLTLDANGTDVVAVNASKVNVRLASVSVYANNAAAVAGGLVSGDLYRTNADPDYLAIVH